MRYFLIISCIFIIIIISCNKKQVSNEELIIGDWKFDTTIISKKDFKSNKHKPPPSFFYKAEEFEFLENGICNYKNGLFEIANINEKGKRYTKFNGTKLKYKYNNSKLELRYLNDSIFYLYNIYKITKDSLIFGTNNNELSIYTKTKYNIDKREHYDKIIVSSSGCFGSCEVNNTLIEKNGNSIFDNILHNKQNGIFNANITKEKFLALENNFKKADISKLKNYYTVDASDGNQITITFIKNGKIYKTISDYLSQSPVEFIQAYTPIVYLSQSEKLNNIKLKPEFDFSIFICFYSKLKSFELRQSESFFLKTELLKSKVSNTNFKAVYKLTGFKYLGSSNVKTIETDGKYYRFIFTNGNKITYDLGYDFIKKNNLKEAKL